MRRPYTENEECYEVRTRAADVMAHEASSWGGDLELTRCVLHIAMRVM